MKLLSRFTHLFSIKHLVKIRVKRLTPMPLVFRLYLWVIELRSLWMWSSKYIRATVLFNVVNRCKYRPKLVVFCTIVVENLVAITRIFNQVKEFRNWNWVRVPRSDCKSLPWNIRSLELSFLGSKCSKHFCCMELSPLWNFRSSGANVPNTFAPWNFRPCGTFVPREQMFQTLLPHGTFVPVELSFLGSKCSKHFCPMELSSLWNFRSLRTNIPRTFAPYVEKRYKTLMINVTKLQ